MKLKFKKTKIEGCYVIEPEMFSDKRGILRRHFGTDEFKSHGIDSNVIQCNISENPRKCTLRGFHYQATREARTISCMRGSVYDIVVDLRPESKTFLKWVSFKINERNRLSLHIPAVCGNAFLTLEANTVLHYYHSRKYSKKMERGVRYNDPLFRFKWPHEPELISEKDKSWSDFTPFLSKRKAVPKERTGL